MVGLKAALSKIMTGMNSVFSAFSSCSLVPFANAPTYSPSSPTEAHIYINKRDLPGVFLVSTQGGFYPEENVANGTSSKFSEENVLGWGTPEIISHRQEWLVGRMPHSHKPHLESRLCLVYVLPFCLLGLELSSLGC